MLSVIPWLHKAPLIFTKNTYIQCPLSSTVNPGTWRFLYPFYRCGNRPGDVLWLAQDLTGQNRKARAGIRFSRPTLMLVSRVAVARPGPSSPCSLGMALPCPGRICPPLPSVAEAYSVPTSSSSVKLLFSAFSVSSPFFGTGHLSSHPDSS